MILLPLYVFFLLGVFVPGILIAYIPGEITSNFLLMCLVVLWISLRLVLTGMKGKRRLTLMSYYIFMYVFMGVQPLLSVWSGLFPHNDVAFEQDKLQFTIFMVMLGIAAFELGYYRLKDMAEQPNSIPLNIIRTERSTNVSLWLLWTSISIVSFLVLLSIVRYGPNIYLGLRDGGFSVGNFQAPESSQAENLLVIFGLRGLSATLLFITIYLWKVRHTTVHKSMFLTLRIAMIYLIIFNIIVSNPLNAPRLWSGSIILTSLFIAAKWKGPRSFLLWSSSACVILLLLFSGTDPRRIFGQQLLKGEEITLANTGKEIVLSIQNLPGDLNFDAFQMISYTKDYTDKYGFSMGNQMLLPAFFWVPRSVWSSKPIGTPDIVAEDAQFLHFNVSSPLWSEGYINFGVFGLFSFLLIFGFFARRCDNSLIQLHTKTAFTTIVTCFFASNTFILLRGDLTSGTMYLQLVSGVSYIVILLIKRANKRITPLTI